MTDDRSATLNNPNPSQQACDRVVIEELAVVADLPVGWTLDFDETLHRLVLVGEGTPWCDADLCPSVTLRAVPFLGGAEEFRSLAQTSLEEMPPNYQNFEVEWVDPVQNHRALRCYSFHLRPSNQRVTQLQGLIEATNAAIVYVIDCTAPSSTFGKIESLFRYVVLSVDSLGPDYTADE
ncbi:hypothetical protein [Ferrimicrobium sp.]|uniref:hypothetical protein n=1 Tax=Ferrimicrobium sp. TaxID=2926050 RepID=UPI00261AEE5B|nr:hypothetical protein [Ferrimicrobium sp.]